MRSPRELVLPTRLPFAASELLAFLAARAIPGVEEVSGGRYRRTTAEHGIVELQPREDGVVVGSGCEAPAVARTAARLFDCGADPAVIDPALAADPLLAPLVARRPGLRVPGAWEPFELVVRAVLGQQVSVAAASTLSGRVAAVAGTPLRGPDGTLTHVFPSPEAVAGADLGGIGLPGRRVATVKALAEAGLDLGGRPERAAAMLLALPGIGPWTVAYVAMRVFRDPDALPVTDLGLRRAFEAAGLRGDERTIRGRAERWRPWRSYAVMHLWASLRDQPR